MTTQQAQHTPTPWRISRGRELRGPDNMAQVASLEPYAVPMTQANAAFIARACNSYDDLLAACKSLIAALALVDLPKHPEPPQGAAQRALGAAAANAYAAVAKATGGQP